MFFYLYQITNKVNGKIYVGVHKTKNLDDGYMGSGAIIQRAVKKHGLENFEKVILETFEDQESMYAREKEVVTDEFLLREDVYNLRRGGFGGFEYINKNGLSGFCDVATARKGRAASDSLLLQKYGEGWRSIIGKRASIAGNEALRIKREQDKEFDLKLKENLRKASLKAIGTESKAKRKETYIKIKHQQGERNSNFGKCWIWHELIGSKTIDKNLLPLYLDQGWTKGRRL